MQQIFLEKNKLALKFWSYLFKDCNKITYLFHGLDDEEERFVKAVTHDAVKLIYLKLKPQLRLQNKSWKYKLDFIGLRLKQVL